MRKSADKSNQTAFTLIELLTVILIISIMMAVMLPAISAVKKNARRLICQSRLKQIALAFSQYAAENDGIIIPAHSMMHAKDPLDLWNFKLLKYMGTDFDLIHIFENSLTIWFCPEDKDPFPAGFKYYPHNKTFTSFAINGYCDNRTQKKIGPGGNYKFSQINAPAQCALMFETSHAERIIDAGNPNAIAKGFKISDDEHHRNSSGFYHKNTMNISFLDGRVENIKPKKAPHVQTPPSLAKHNDMFWNQLTLPPSSQNKNFWGPGY